MPPATAAVTTVFADQCSLIQYRSVAYRVSDNSPPPIRAASNAKAGMCRSNSTKLCTANPASPVQARLLERLRGEYGHVSWERVASGSAMNDLYRFCCIEHERPLPNGAVDGAELAVRAESGDAAAEAALDLFVDLYGAWVGNVALLYRPHGGLYIAGGVSAHLRMRMQSARFMEAAVAKGRMRSVVERTPIFLVTSSRLGVAGALAVGQCPVGSIPVPPINQ